jgi:hypothetical protein
MKTENESIEPCLKEGKTKVWKFVHHSDFTYQTTIFINRKCDYEWLSISEDGTIRVKGSNSKGYAWDGCTPKKNCLHITWGNFDGQIKRFGKGDYKPYTYYASMIHDVLYQYKRCAPVTRKEADRLFLYMLKEAGFMWDGLFYAGVRAFGWLYSGWKYKKKNDIITEK